MKRMLGAGIIIVVLGTSALAAERIHLAQAGQTVAPPPVRPPSLDQTTTSCQINCDASAMNCMNNCGLITGAQAAAAPDFRAQCSLSCSSQPLVCKQLLRAGRSCLSATSAPKIHPRLVSERGETRGCHFLMRGGNHAVCAPHRKFPPVRQLEAHLNRKG